MCALAVSKALGPAVFHFDVECFQETADHHIETCDKGELLRGRWPQGGEHWLECSIRGADICDKIVNKSDEGALVRRQA